MRAVLQRVKSSQVKVDGKIVGKIESGWLVLLGIGNGDNREIAEYMADRCMKLRGFVDEAGKMNRSVQDVGGAILVVSQFTLYADCIRSRRPSFDGAAPPVAAKALYETFCETLLKQGVPTERGVFQADMQVSLVNDGPVTFLLERNA